MACLLCGSSNEADFAAEMIIHFSDLTNIDNPGVYVFPKLVTCLDCGIVRFNVSKPELPSLAAGTPASEPLAMAAE
jgi:hypothetical protein